jgi:hypothetical protein
LPKIPLLNFLRIAAGALALAALVVFFLLGDVLGSQYYFGMLLIVPLGLAEISLRARLEKQKKIARARELWGKPIPKTRDFGEISLCYRSDGAGPGKIPIDEKTCEDLNLHAFFAEADRTLTRPGEAMLYSMLRSPCCQDSRDELERRRQIISLFETEDRLREEFQAVLVRVGVTRDNALTHLLWDKLPGKTAWAPLFDLAALAALTALVLPFFLGPRLILAIPLLFALNAAIHYKLKDRHAYLTTAIAQLTALLRTAGSLAGAKLPGLEAEQEMLRGPLKRVAKLLRKTRLLLTDFASGSDLYMLYEYLKVYFLVDIRGFYQTIEEIGARADDLRLVYRLLGNLDALQAVASYRQNLAYTEPTLVPQGKFLQAVNIRHPLLKNPVPNSIEIGEKGILITGSNMAGKSTFLRTLGLNALLAQSIYTCLADRYTAGYLYPATSINKMDDIGENKSLYYAEAERLRDIITPAYTLAPGLCLVDELLAGTNYGERLAASLAILNYLKGKNALTVVATHDLDLADRLQGTYLCYHFSDSIDKNNLQFDYTLKPGIAATSNAIKLLEYLGYPGEIVREAQENLA